MPIQRLIATTNTWAPLPLRIALGSIVFLHGAQKIFGAWGGAGLNAWMASGPAPYNLQPAWAWLAAVAFIEFIGGLFIFIGFLTRVGAGLVAIVLAAYMIATFREYGFFLANRGAEYIVALFAMAISLVISGGGNLSIDSLLDKGERK
jgi:putative oxidoreductase